MPPKSKCSRLGAELANRHTSAAGTGLNHCRWETHDADTPAYDVVPPDADPPPLALQARKRTPHPVASRVKVRRDEMIFVQAPRKRTAQTASVSVKQVAVPSNLRRTALSAAHRRSLQDYKGSAQTKQRIEIYLKAGHPFAEAVRRAGARDKRRPSMARARKPIGPRTARQKAADKRAVARLMYDNSRA